MASRGRDAPKDNYAEFLARLDAATASLSARRDSLHNTLAIAVTLFEHNNTGLQLWTQRLEVLNALLARPGEATAVAGLVADLHGVALKMEPMFRNRTERLGERLSALRGRSREIERSLLELEKSRVKLNSSRMLSQERENLSNAVAALGGTPEGSGVAVPDPGLRDDLKEAREAIILAEALLEVKGD